ncbi:hypothetical protein Tco_1397156, partial [Tanacetum coccineum]
DNVAKRCRRCSCERCWGHIIDGVCSIFPFGDGDSFAYDPNLNSFNESLNFSDYPTQPQYQTYSCELCGNDAHDGYDYPPQHAQPQDIQELLHKLLKKLQIIREELAEYINSPSLNRPAFYDDDDDDEYTIQYREYLENSFNAITPDLSTEEPDNSLSMGDEHLDTIPKTESDEIDSLLEKFADELTPINPIPLGIHEANFNPKKDIRLDDQMFYDDTSSDGDSFEDIDYVEASPPDYELVSIEEVEDDILHAKLSNIYLLIAKIKSLNDNPTPSFLSHFDNSLLEFEIFSNHTEETRSGSTTTHAENSLPEYDLFHFEIESDQGELSRVVRKTIDKIDVFLDIDVSTDLEDGYHDSEGDIIYLESLLINNTIPNLSPEDCLDLEGSCARCFVHRSLSLQILSMLILGIRYP